MDSESNLAAAAQVAQLRAENERLKRAKLLRESNGINFYRPHEKQDKFHAAAAVTGRYCRTGNRGGKTKCGAAEDVAFALGYRPWYKYQFDILGVRIGSSGQRETYVARHHEGGEDHPLVTLGIPRHPVKILLLVADWDKAKEIFTNDSGSYELLGEYFQLIPKDAIVRVNKSRGGHIDRIDVKRPAKYGGGVSSIYIDTVESWKHNRMSAESSDWDCIHLDEPCPEQMFVGHKRGLVDRGGKFWINCTPLDQPWINDEFVPPNQNVVKEANEGITFEREVSNNQKVSRFIITWSIHDNPYNKDSAIAEFEASLNAEQRACRLHGLPLSMAGLVYTEFVWDVHVLQEIPKGWENYYTPPSDYTIRYWWDTHIRKPQAILFLATAPDGTTFVYDELFCNNSIGINAEMVKEKIEGRFCVNQEIDPLALIANPVDNTSIVDTLAEYGLFVTPATKDKSRGINMVKQKLRERKENGRPTIYFSPHLKETLWEFTHYCFDPDTNKPKDENDHQMENLYRAVLSELEYVAPVSDEDYKFRRQTVIGFSEFTKPLSRNASISGRN